MCSDPEDSGGLVRAVLCSLLANLVFVLASTAPASASDFKVGDQVEFEFMGGVTTGTVTGFTGTGWPTVKFKYRGREMEQPQPPDWLRRVAPASDQEPKSRTWTSANGKFKVRATLIEHDEDQIRLEKRDGSQISVPISKLSAEDQQYLSSLKDTTEKENPFGSESGTTQPSHPEEGLPEARTSRVEPLVMVARRSWKFEPDVSNRQVVASLQPVEVREDASADSFHDRASFVISADGTGAAIAVSNPFDDKTRIAAYDLSTGELRGSMQFSSEHLGVRDVAAHGDQVVTANDVFYRGDHVAIWESSEGQLNRTGGWQAPTSRGSSDGVTFAKFVGDGRLLTSNRTRQAVLWDTAKHAAVTSFPMNQQPPPCFSPNRACLAVVDEDTIFFVDMTEGRISASLPIDSGQPLAMAFSDDGQRFAAYFKGVIKLWNLQDGTALEDVYLVESPNVHTLEWVDDRFVFVGGSLLVDTDLRAIAWKFTHTSRNKQVAKGSRGQFWYLHWGDGAGSLVPFELPQASVRSACEELVAADLTWFEPGPLTIKMGEMASARGKVLDELTDRAESSGYTVQPGASMVLSMHVEKQEPQSIKVKDFFETPWTDYSEQTIRFTETVSHMRLELDGKELWTRTAHNFVPHTLQLKQDETPQQAATRLTTPDPKFFIQASLPSKGNLFANNDFYLGTSKLGPQGPQ